jgi:MFS family permease
MRTILLNLRLLGLLLCGVSTLFVGMSLFPIFPLYAAELGASPTAAGIALALIYVASALGPTVTGMLSGRMRRRTLLIAAGVIGPPSIALLGAATALWQATALMAIAWFCGGVIITLVNVCTGIYAADAVRGRAYALMALAPPIGGLLGGAATSALLSRFDFTIACFGLAAFWAILPIVAFFTLDARAEQRRPQAQAAPQARFRISGAFALVLAASLLAHIAIAGGRLGSSLLMQSVGLPASDVALAAAISGSAAIPIILLIGALADRAGRRVAFTLVSVIAAGGAIMLLGATEPWQFCLAVTFLLVAYCSVNAQGAALVADLVPSAALGSAMARYTATGSIAAVVSLAGAGYAFVTFGPIVLFALAALLALIAGSVVGFGARRGGSRRVQPAVAPGGD